MRTTRLKLARVKSGKRQRDLAVAVGVDHTYLSRLENGSCLPSIKLLQKLAGELKVSAAELFADFELGEAWKHGQ